MENSQKTGLTVKELINLLALAAYTPAVVFSSLVN